MSDITRTPVPPPRRLQPCGTGAFLSEQQYCYERGYRAGVKAARKAIRDKMQSEKEKTK